MESKSYKKINHFKEILAQYQVKDIQISDKVIEQIQQYIEKENISFEDLTYGRTKEILKELGLNQYCEHTNFIRIKLGVNQLIIDVETKDFFNNFNKYYK